MSFYGLKGTVKYRSGTSGTEKFTAGARILQVHAIGAGTISMPANGSPTSPLTITTVAADWFRLDEHHVDHILVTGGLSIVFAGTSSYFIEYIDAPGAS
jgi:hypothetical protein